MHCLYCKTEIKKELHQKKNENNASFKKRKFCSRECSQKGDLIKIGQFKKTHGMTRTRLYRKFRRILERCNDKNHPFYKHYGGRGIKCDWASFDAFSADMLDSYKKHVADFGEKQTTIERIDVDGNYCKKNCCWATLKEQARNKRNNRVFEINGEIKSVTEWSEIYKVSRTKVFNRLRNGWEIKNALKII